MSIARWFQIRLVLPLNLYRLARKFIISVISQARFMRAFLYALNELWVSFMDKHPVLYSYRRCPYAMRARIGIYLSGIQVEQREIVFWDKPEVMLQASPKGTVPVLVLSDGQVIDESRDILFWAIQNRLDGEQGLLPARHLTEINRWIDENDDFFKLWLDKYKYSDRFPEQPQSHYREKGEVFLQSIEQALAKSVYLLGNNLTVADIALFPFVRQFSNVDKKWFAEANYPHLKRWLERHLKADYFLAIMKNRPVWEPGHKALWLDEPDLATKDQFRVKAIESI